MLLEKYISPNADAKVLVLFGGNPIRRDEVIRHLMVIPNLTIVGTLSEAEGMEALKRLPRVDVVLIGGRYNMNQRKRIKSYVAVNLPQAKVNEPGVDYTYNEQMITESIKRMIIA